MTCGTKVKDEKHSYNNLNATNSAHNVSNILHQYITGLNLLGDFDHKRPDTQGITKRTRAQISVDEFLSIIYIMKGDFAVLI